MARSHYPALAALKREELVELVRWLRERRGRFRGQIEHRRRVRRAAGPQCGREQGGPARMAAEAGVRAQTRQRPRRRTLANEKRAAMRAGMESLDRRPGRPCTIRRVARARNRSRIPRAPTSFSPAVGSISQQAASRRRGATGSSVAAGKFSRVGVASDRMEPHAVPSDRNRSAPFEVDPLVDRQVEQVAAQAIEPELDGAGAHPVATADQACLA
jgi:hypothetical protein